MSLDVRETTTIHRAPSDVATFASDPMNDAEWIGGVREVEWVTEPPLRVGSQVRRVARFMRRRVEYVLEVCELEPGARVVMRSIKAPFPMTVTYTFAGSGDLTQAGVRVEGGSGPLFKIGGPLMATQVRRNLRGDLKRLKAKLEG